MMIRKQKLTFDAVAVVAAIDIEGSLVAYVLKDGAIGVEELLKLSRLIRRRFRREKVNIFLDNLRIHYAKEFK